MTFETDFFSDGNVRQNSECVIFVEGKDDALFVSNLLSLLGADPKKVGIVEVGGTGNFQNKLSAFFKSSSFSQGINKSIAIICDADDCATKAAERVNLALSSVRQPTIEVGKIVVAKNGIRFGLFLLPDCESNGDLEKLCLETVADLPLEKEAEVFIAAAEAHAGGKLKGSRYKRKAQVFLAGMESLVRGAGHGFKDGYFRSNHDKLKPLLKFLEDVTKESH